MTSDRQAELLDELGKQLEMLDLACNNYDAGSDVAARQIATTVRTLAHTFQKKDGTYSSHSLLDQLGVTSVLRFPEPPSWLRPMPNQGPTTPSTWMFTPGLVSIGTFFDGTAPVYWPAFETAPTAGAVDFEAWWTDPVVLLNGGEKFSRRRLVRDMANTDGGAHVGKLRPEYRALSRGAAFGFTTSRDEPFDVDPVPAIMRQIGEEARTSIRAHFGDALGASRTPLAGELRRRRPDAHYGSMQVSTG